MTTAMKSLTEDATKAGYAVSVEPDGESTLIVKRVGRWKKPRGLMIYGDGSAIDLSVETFGIAKCLRSYKDMRAVLGI